MASGTASGVDENNIPEGGRVEQVCRQWLVREDGVLALRMQEKEIESHYGLNRQQRRLVRSDLITARVAQTEEEEEARQEFEEIMKQLEEEDERLAKELHEELSRQEEEQLKNIEEADAELARQLQEKEKRKYQRQQEKKQQELEHEQKLTEESLNQHIQEATLLGESLSQTMKDTHLRENPTPQDDMDFTDFYQPPGPEMTDDEIRQLQEMQDERKSQTFKDKQLATEIQDRELAKLLQAQEKRRAKKLQEKARQKAILEKSSPPEQTGTKSKLDDKSSPYSSRRHSKLRSSTQINCESSQELNKLRPYDLTLQSTHSSSGSIHSHSSDSTSRLSQFETQSLDTSIRNSSCLTRHPETACSGVSPTHSINIATVIDPTYRKKKHGDPYITTPAMETPASPRNSTLLPPIISPSVPPSAELATGGNVGEESYYDDDDDESPAPPYMPIQGQRRTLSLEKGHKGKPTKQKSKEGCKTQ